MKNSIPALALVSVIFTAPASAASISEIQTPVNTASVIFNVDDDNVATLTGTVERLSDKVALEQAIMELEDVEEVRNLLAH